MRIWNPTTDSYEQYGGTESLHDLATMLVSDDAFVDALALKTDLAEFTYASYTPTFSQSATLSVTSLVSYWIQIGKFVHFHGWAEFTSAGSSGTGIGLTMPTPGRGSTLGGHHAIGIGMIEDAGNTTYKAVAINDGPGIVFYDMDGHFGANRVGAANGPQFAIGSGDRIWWNVTYEAA